MNYIKYEYEFLYLLQNIHYTLLKQQIIFVQLQNKSFINS